VFRSHSNLAYKTLQIKLFITKRNTNCLAVPCTLAAVAGRHHKTLCNRTVKSLHRSGNPLEKNEDDRTYPVFTTSYLMPNSLKNWRAGHPRLGRGAWDSTAIRTNSPIIIYCYYYYYYYYSSKLV